MATRITGQAIQVRRGSSGRFYNAKAYGGSVRSAHDYALDGEGNAAKAANALCAKLGWAGEMKGGQLADNSYVFVFVE